METSEIIRRFVTDKNAAIEIEKGGSGRRFFRLTLPEHGSAILCIHDDTREENALAPDIAAFLRDTLGLPVPKVIEWNRELGTILFEDLGAQELWAMREDCAELRMQAWGDAVVSLAKLHSQESLAAFLKSGPRTMPGFGPELYRWERDYFRDNAVRRILGADLPPARAEALEKELAALAARLDALPRTLVHRDCQSQNILWKDGRAWFIDFQGLRTGTGFYDLGSLLFDPYVNFTHGERARLLGDYAEAAGVPRNQEFIRAFLDASAQRLMQALGAYHFLAYEKGRRAFLEHVRPALGNLVLVTRDNPALPLLKELAEELYVRHLVESGNIEIPLNAPVRGVAENPGK